jgi:raffinose/stachyose/melibiose transport system substrate-binding protein
VEKAMGANVGVFLPPFVDQPLNGVVEFPGDGFAMTNYCQNKDVAADFLKFLADPAAQKIVADEGLIPTVTGSSASDPLANELLGYAANQGYTRYPMIDNVIQGEVQAVGATVLVAAFAGTMSTHDALQKMQDALMALPADRRSASGYK